jgi:transposase-like protein
MLEGAKFWLSVLTELLNRGPMIFRQTADHTF